MSYMQEIDDFIGRMSGEHNADPQQTFEEILAHIRNGNSHPLDAIEARIVRSHQVEVF